MAESPRNFTSVYHSLEAILNFLKNVKFAQVTEVEELLRLFNNNYDKDVAPNTQHLHPFIVVEGLDGSGKTMLTKMLTKKLRGQKLSTPPSCLVDLRDWFDSQSKDLRRAYYSLGNYIVGQQVEKTVQNCPVIMDRFWHSTAAYAIADEIKEHNLQLPPQDDSLYKWPSDLTKPDIVFFLDVDEYWRLQRLASRNTNTVEEQQIAVDLIWRKNVIDAYKRMTKVNLKQLNANQFPKRVLTAAQNYVASYF